jgi:hypothetical protein
MRDNSPRRSAHVTSTASSARYFGFSIGEGNGIKEGRTIRRRDRGVNRRGWLDSREARRFVPRAASIAASSSNVLCSAKCLPLGHPPVNRRPQCLDRAKASDSWAGRSALKSMVKIVGNKRLIGFVLYPGQ